MYPFQQLKKDNRDIDRLVKIELGSTNRSPYESKFLNQDASFRSKRSSTIFHSLLSDLL
jgi:hypothetical protein